MKNNKILLLILTVVLVNSCSDYLDVVPDNVATLDNAFSDRVQTEKYLFTCYSRLPVFDNVANNPAIMEGDEFWLYYPAGDNSLQNIVRGNQNKVDPYLDYWSGGNGGKSLWQGIRNCNIFLEKINKVTDLEPWEKARWIAEVKFLKAYYHWYLFRMYGPIPIVDENFPISASPDEVRVKRESVDRVVDYIVALIDSSLVGDGNNGLPLIIDETENQLGRITRPIALSIKAKVLVTAASPLFNGNQDMAGFNDEDGNPLFNATYSEEKWQKAAEACRVAIDACEQAGIVLLTSEISRDKIFIPDNHKIEMAIRNAVCERWNQELIWGYVGNGSPSSNIQRNACPHFKMSEVGTNAWSRLAPTMRIAELFYSTHGVPIDEDVTWDYENRYTVRTAGEADTTIQNGYQTAALHFDREPRFYANLGFDGARWLNMNTTYTIKSKLGEYSGKQADQRYSITGYFAKKLVNWGVVFNNRTPSFVNYPWPVMRLADLYLLYAEALNETGDLTTSLTYLNAIRERAGLLSIEESWTNYSTNPDKYTTKEGLREIIQQERGIELALEGKRFWDLRRWKKAEQVINAPIYGWDILQEDVENYTRKTELFIPQFDAPKDYFWPIDEYEILINPNLVQNLGW